MKQELRQSVEQHLNQHQLNDDQLQTLMNMQANAQAGNAKPEITSNGEFHKYARLACAALVMLAVSLIWLPEYWAGRAADMPQAIAMEVAKNHIKLKPLEVKTQTLAPIRSYFTELDFSPVRSLLYESRGNLLLGARYCSIAGVSAAQLRYKDAEGQMQTLYEVGYDPEIYGPLPDIDKGEMPLVIIARGVKTTIWVEQDLLMVSAENLP